MKNDHTFLVKYPNRVIWRILKSDVTYNDLRVLHAVMAYFNEVDMFFYDTSISDIKERRKNRKPVTVTRFRMENFRKLLTSENIREGKNIMKSLSRLCKMGFISFKPVKLFSSTKYIMLFTERTHYRYIPYKVIDEYNTKNVLAIKILLWLQVIMKASSKNKDGNFSERMSIQDFIDTVCPNLQRLPRHKVIDKIKKTIAIIVKGDCLLQCFTDEVGYINFLWKPMHQGRVIAIKWDKSPLSRINRHKVG